MRKIKFRAWDKDNQKMFYDVSVRENHFCVYRESEGWLSISGEICEQSSIILMQFTGLKDKNSTEIYEGDIIIIGCYHLRAVIEYEHCGFVMHHVKGSKRRKYCANSRCEPIFLNCNISVEVIGNIHENPELL